MDILNGPDFLYSRICLRPFGLWPFQDPKSKLISRVITLMAVSTVLIPHIMKTYEFRNDFHILLMCIPSLLYYAHYITKFLYIAFCEEKFRNVLERIKDDFVTFRGESLNHLTNYSEEARKFNTFYTSKLHRMRFEFIVIFREVYLCSTVVIYNVTAFIPHMLDFVFPLENATRPRHAARLVKYNIHQIDNNFYFVLIHGMIFDVVAIAIIIGFDALFINCAQHACALFKIVVVELRKCTKLDKKMSNSASDLVTLQRRQDIFYAKLVRTIVAHKHAIEFTDNLESTYALVNFLMIGIAVATITLTEFETIVHVNEVDIMCRFAFFSGGELISMLYQNWPGQRIKDHSLRVHSSWYVSTYVHAKKQSLNNHLAHFDFSFECEWYREDVSYKGKRLLMFMMLKSEVPSALTAGKLFILDLQNYVKIFKASLSYFAFLSSVAKMKDNVLNGPYYVYSNNYLSPFGMWPLQSYKKKVLLRKLMYVGCNSAFIPHVCKAYEVRNNFQYFFVCIPSIIFYIQVMLKMACMILNEDKCKELFKQIKNDFEIYTGESLRILNKYAEQAHYFMGTMVVYNTLAFMPLFLDFLVPLNETRPRIITKHMKYNIKRIENNYFVTTLHGYVLNILGMMVVVGFDSLLLSYTQHACALFQVVRNELKDTIDKHEIKVTSHAAQYANSRDVFYQDVVKVIIKHKHAIELSIYCPITVCFLILIPRHRFADLVESTYAATNLLVIGITLGFITLVEFETVQHKDNRALGIRFAIITIVELLHILFHNYPGQRIKDHSLMLRLRVVQGGHNRRVQEAFELHDAAESEAELLDWWWTLRSGNGKLCNGAILEKKTVIVRSTNEHGSLSFLDSKSIAVVLHFPVIRVNGTSHKSSAETVFH
ncbi:hypothetical protein TSAR_015445, partial [Trichomalopsis sarcophagae]